tara:strand:+ start:8124 stop:8873 length:750 start_codon:yes stop_codon:yes gene_type:complete
LFKSTTTPHGDLKMQQLESLHTLDIKGEICDASHIIKSISMIGQRIPIIVTPTEGEYKYKVLDGNRRLCALKQLSEEKVDAYVVTNTAEYNAITTLVANISRTRNVAAESDALVTLQAEGLTAKEISEQTGLPLRNITELVDLRGQLIAKAFTMLREGNMSLSTAKRLQRLEPNAQEELILNTEGRLRGKDVESALRAENNKLLQEIAQIPAVTTGHSIMASQLDQLAQKLTGEKRKVIINAAEIIRGL